VTHGGFLRLVHCACVGHCKGRLVRNCSIGEVHVCGSVRAVVRWGDVSHLSDSKVNPPLLKQFEVL
jgi:hypothetical protein